MCWRYNLSDRIDIGTVLDEQPGDIDSIVVGSKVKWSEASLRQVQGKNKTSSITME